MLWLPSGGEACQAGPLQKLGRVFSALTSPVVSSDSSVLTAQTFLPVTLSLTFCNHEILMTDIEFKVQFMSESSGGKGSCKGTAFQVIEGFWSGAVQQLSGRVRRSRISHGSVSAEHEAAGSLHAGVGASSVAVPSTRVSGAGESWQGSTVFAAGMQVAAGCRRVCCTAGLDVINSSGGKR